MNTSSEVIAQLRLAVNAEALAVLQYKSYQAVLSELGLAKLAKEIDRIEDEEQAHLERFLGRMAYLGSPAEVSSQDVPVLTGVREILAAAATAETQAVEQYQNAVDICREERDTSSRKIFEDTLVDEETDHRRWFVQQTALYDAIGEQNYLAQWMG